MRSSQRVSAATPPLRTSLASNACNQAARHRPKRGRCTERGERQLGRLRERRADGRHRPEQLTHAYVRGGAPSPSPSSSQPVTATEQQPPNVTQPEPAARERL